MKNIAAQTRHPVGVVCVKTRKGSKSLNNDKRHLLFRNTGVRTKLGENLGREYRGN